MIPCVRISPAVGLAAAAALAIGAGCASQTTLPEPVRVALASRYQGRVMELRHSCHFGDLYDENEKQLLTPYQFDDIHHIVDLKGNPIHPRDPKGIIPAGARFVVERIEFPDRRALATRMLTTPRYNPWVYLRPAPDETRVPKTGKPFIVLLPMDLTSEQAVEAEINKRLAPEGEVLTWLTARRPSVRVAIEHKDVVDGMHVDELIASQGEPQRWFNDTHQGRKARVAWYRSREVWLIADTVVRVGDGRPEPTGPAGATAESGRQPEAPPASP